MSDWIVTAASALVVAFMVGVAALLGFRERARLDAGTLRAIARDEGASMRDYVIAPNGRAALALLSTGKLLGVRVMADGVGARAVASLRRVDNGVRAAFADLGFPEMHVRFDAAPPAWLLSWDGARA